MAPKPDNIEMAKRIRIVTEWIIDDWASADIREQIIIKWDVDTRTAARYIAKARDRWNEEEDERVDRRRRKMIENLKKTKRSMLPAFKGTPAGMNALLRIDKEISRLENLYPSDKIEDEVGKGVHKIIIEE